MQNLNTNKLLLAKVCHRIGLFSILFFIQRGVWVQYARAVNYHDIPSTMVGGFEAQLRYFKQHYENVGRAELNAILCGQWLKARPGIVLTFDDGFRSHADHVAPLLEEYGFTGWFFVPTQFVDTPSEDQWRFAADHGMVPRGNDHHSGRIAMSWDQVRDLASRGHVIGSHTCNHQRLKPELTRSQMKEEIFRSKACLEAQLEREIDVFCWVGGEEESYSRESAELVRKAGYRVSFMSNNQLIRQGRSPFGVQRTNVEAWYPMEVLKFQLSGLLDLFYMPKRRRVNRLTSVD